MDLLIAFIVFMFKQLPMKAYFIMTAVMGVDGGIQYFKIKESDNIRRLLTGFIGGFGLASIKMSIVFSIIRIVKNSKKKKEYQ